MFVTGIMAMTKTGVIGVGDSLPWKLPNELKHFRRKTENKNIAVGGRTLLTLPPAVINSGNRRWFVYTSNPNVLKFNYESKYDSPINDNVEFCRFEDHLDVDDEIIVAGGGKLYKHFFDHYGYDRFYLTEVDMIVVDEDSTIIDEFLLDHLKSGMTILQSSHYENNISYTINDLMFID